MVSVRICMLYCSFKQARRLSYKRNVVVEPLQEVRQAISSRGISVVTLLDQRIQTSHQACCPHNSACSLHSFVTGVRPDVSHCCYSRISGVKGLRSHRECYQNGWDAPVGVVPGGEQRGVGRMVASAQKSEIPTTVRVHASVYYRSNQKTPPT
jgi:hypothetical protein